MIKTTHRYNAKFDTVEEATADLIRAIKEFETKKLPITTISLYRSGKYEDGKYIKDKFEYPVSVAASDVEPEFDDDVLA